ncbi:MAG: DNA translocase FtsK [Undibacterium sp.]|nr:DNA translocase FtsK [Opitutaceae bacterium]
MPKPETSNSNDGPSFQAPRYRPNWSVALVCLFLGIFVAVALVAYDPMQSGHQTTAPRPKNPMGWLGAESIWVLLFSLGASTWLLPVFFGWMTYMSVKAARHLTGTRVIAMIIAVTSLSGLAAMVDRIKESNYFPRGPGGLIGKTLYEKLFADAAGTFGSGLLFGTLYCVALLFIFTRDIGTEIDKISTSFSDWRKQRAQHKAAITAENARAREEKARQRSGASSVTNSPLSSRDPLRITPQLIKAVNTEPVGPSGGRKTFAAKSGEDPLAKPISRTPLSPESADPVVAKPVVVPAPPPRALTRSTPQPPPAPAAIANTATDVRPLAVAATGKFELNIVKTEEPKKAAKITLPQSDDKTYEFPPLSLLKEQAKPDSSNSEEEHRGNAENLLRILGEFGVEVTLGEIHVGPVITRYEVVPAAGVRVEKIAGLDKNIALGMRAQSVRILAPIPGKAAVGVEVPNLHPTPVGMRELLESEDWASAKAEIPIALGKDVSGVPLISDLAKMPHLLIAGATGSGKSVCINSIVASILYSKSPKDLRLIMVDPKVVELKIFNSLPHMLIPVVTEPKKVPAALKWLLGEMEQRYQLFAKVNVRNIVGFNSRKKAGKPEPTATGEVQGSLSGVDPLLDDGVEVPERLPYIVAIIDELADLMMVAPAEIETSIARLAQLARAAGIHLIIATQRPSVNVITGVIKANLPSRIAFQVASQVDSRTILDTKGADTLIGRGDMLFSPPGSSRLVRSQGAFVSDEEVMAMVEFLKKNGPPQYAQSVQAQIDRDAREGDEDEEGEGEDSDLGDDEELYNQALDVLKSTKRASTSMIQRRLRIGYNRAARIMDLMEDKGIVGPENGSSPREILVDLDSL